MSALDLDAIRARAEAAQRHNEREYFDRESGALIYDDVPALIARVRDAEAQLSQAVEAAAQLEGMMSAVRGEPVSEFMASFPAVREAMDLRATVDADTETLRGHVEWLEGLKAAGNNICAHCKQPFPAESVGDHVRTCEASPMVAEVTRLRERLAMAVEFQTPHGGPLVSNVGRWKGKDGWAVVADDGGWLDKGGAWVNEGDGEVFATTDAAFEALDKLPVAK